MPDNPIAGVNTGSVVVEAVLSGTISVETVLSGTVEVEQTIDGIMQLPDTVPWSPVYDGNYVVTPLAHAEQVLPTNNKRMTDDVTVLRVPYYETSNEHGLTVYIASGV